ncbi:MAG: hypothetical protein OXU20_22210 [Myxococcales bacterium]|nr:hypothetical protein [Myxococcales bacterium]
MDDKSKPGDLDDDDKMALARRLRERHQRGVSSVRGRSSRATFRALVPQIENAIREDAWSLRTIHAELHEHEDFAWKYNRFLELCREFGIEGGKQGRAAMLARENQAIEKKGTEPQQSDERLAAAPKRPKTFRSSDGTDLDSLVGKQKDDDG